MPFVFSGMLFRYNIIFGKMIYTGATIVLKRKFSASNFANDCFKHKCTVSFFMYLIVFHWY